MWQIDPLQHARCEACICEMGWRPSHVLELQLYFGNVDVLSLTKALHSQWICQLFICLASGGRLAIRMMTGSPSSTIYELSDITVLGSEALVHKVLY